MRSCVGNFDEELIGVIRICVRSIIFNQRVKTMGRYVIVRPYTTCHHRLLQKRLRRNGTFVKWHNEVYGIFAVKVRRRLARWDHPRRWSFTLYRLVIVPILCAKRSWATEKSIFWNSVFHSLSLCWAPYYPGSGASMAACADLSCFAWNVVRYWMLNDYRHHTMLMLSNLSL